MAWSDYKTTIDGTVEQSVTLSMQQAQVSGNAQDLAYWTAVRDVLKELPAGASVMEAEQELQRRAAEAQAAAAGGGGAEDAPEPDGDSEEAGDSGGESDEASQEPVEDSEDADVSSGQGSLEEEPSGEAETLEGMFGEDSVQQDGGQASNEAPSASTGKNNGKNSSKGGKGGAKPSSGKKGGPRGRAPAKNGGNAETVGESRRSEFVQLRNLPRDVFSETSRQFDAAHISDKLKLTYTDVVTVALAFFCGRTFDSMTRSQVEAYNMLRRSEIGNMSENVKAIRSVETSIRELKSLVYAGNVVSEHTLRRHLGLSLEDTPARDEDVDIVDQDGYDAFHRVMMKQGVEQLKRDDAERNRRFRPL